MCVRESNSLPAPDIPKIAQGHYRIQLQTVRRYAGVHTFPFFIGKYIFTPFKKILGEVLGAHFVL